MMPDRPHQAVCPECGAPATDHGGITQCTANPDLAAVKGPIRLRRSPASPVPVPRPDGLTEGELTAIGWAREHHARWGDKGRGVADSMRLTFPWLGDAELARLALYFGTMIGHAHAVSWPDLDVAGWAQVLKAAAVELAPLDLDDPAERRQGG